VVGVVWGWWLGGGGLFGGGLVVVGVLSWFMLRKRVLGAGRLLSYWGQAMVLSDIKLCLCKVSGKKSPGQMDFLIGLLGKNLTCMDIVFSVISMCDGI